MVLPEPFCCLTGVVAGFPEEKAIAVEQAIVDRSNQVDIADLACGDKESQRFRDLELYHFVLDVAWEHQNSVSPDEANLLLNIRRRLRINEWDHRVLEAKLTKYPKPGNEPHTRSDISRVRRSLQSAGLLFVVRDPARGDYDVIPDELVAVIRDVLRIELRLASYREMMNSKPLRKKAHLLEVLERSNVTCGKYDTVEQLVDRVVRDVPPSRAIASSSPRYGLTSEKLAEWCRELGVSPYGSMEERVKSIITHFDQLRPQVHAGVDERGRWYEFFLELAERDYEALRAQHVIEKDLEIESKFEQATQYLFAELLNNRPLQQPGSNHCDGLVSLGSNYLMWDNKSKETPVHLKDHLDQFHAYMEAATKPVPVFIVIAPRFTEESEAEAVRYHARHFDRNVLLITAEELKALADEWAAPGNKNREAPFPLGLLATTGRFDRKSLGAL